MQMAGWLAGLADWAGLTVIFIFIKDKTSFFARGQRAFKVVLKSIKEEEGEGEEREGEKEKERREERKRKRRIAGKNSERGHSVSTEGFGR